MFTTLRARLIAICVGITMLSLGLQTLFATLANIICDKSRQISSVGATICAWLRIVCNPTTRKEDHGYHHFGRVKN